MNNANRIFLILSLFTISTIYANTHAKETLMSNSVYSTTKETSIVLSIRKNEILIITQETLGSLCKVYSD